ARRPPGRGAVGYGDELSATLGPGARGEPPTAGGGLDLLQSAPPGIAARLREAVDPAEGGPDATCCVRGPVRGRWADRLRGAALRGRVRPARRARPGQRPAAGRHTGGRRLPLPRRL